MSGRLANKLAYACPWTFGALSTKSKSHLVPLYSRGGRRFCCLNNWRISALAPSFCHLFDKKTSAHLVLALSVSEGSFFTIITQCKSSQLIRHLIQIRQLCCEVFLFISTCLTQHVSNNTQLPHPNAALSLHLPRWQCSRGDINTIRSCVWQRGCNSE